jgi:hypothetical protein
MNALQYEDAKAACLPRAQAIAAKHALTVGQVLCGVSSLDSLIWMTDEEVEASALRGIKARQIASRIEDGIEYLLGR